MFIIIPLFIIFIGLAVGGGLLCGAIRARRRINVIAGARFCDAADLRSGMAKMRGKIVAVREDDLLVSPLSRTTCVFFKFVVEEQRTRTVHTGKSAHTETYWHPVVIDVQGVPCTVRDDSGEAFLDLGEAEVVLSETERTHSGMFNSASGALERRLNQRYGFSSKGLIFNKSVRYTEMVLEEGVKVFVVGEVRLHKTGRATFRKKREPLLVTDKNERELVSHYSWRATAFTAGAILVPLLFLCCAGFFGCIGYTISNGSAQANNANMLNQPVRPNQALIAQDPITQNLNDLKHPTDKWVRVRAAYALMRCGAQPGRRDEVAQSLNPLLLDLDTDVRTAGLHAAKVWGTRRHNEAAVRRLTSSIDVLERLAANDALANLAP